MKLIIQIPCYNESDSLPTTLGHLPRDVEGFDIVEWLVIDDGSSDETVQAAESHGVDHIVRHTNNMGLAQAFKTGIDACLARGADVIVNTDADNQYDARDIPNLVRPILEGKAEMVIGVRPILKNPKFSLVKKLLQTLGSWAVRKASNTNIPDAPSGFRAFSRRAASHLNVFSEYTYTLETIIQAGQKGLAIATVPVRVNEVLRPSRLMRSMRSYVFNGLATILRIFITYRAFRIFSRLGALVFFGGLILGLRFVYYFATGDGSGKVQSLILSSLLLASGLLLVIVGILSDLIAVNRMLLEKLVSRTHTIEDQIRSLKETLTDDQG